MAGLPTAAGLAYREAGAPGHGDPVLLVHGYPESSWMWRHVMEALAASGRRAFAPDLPGYGDSEPPGEPATWELHVEALERFRTELGLERVALVVHDWGGLIGLRWACEHPQAVSALVISDTGFFPDGKWHGMAKLLRTEGQGEQAIEAMTRETFGQMMAQISPKVDARTLDEYYKHLGDERRRRGPLELYRSGDFAKLAPHDGKLAALGVPTLLLWGADDAFAPVAGAHRFAREIPHAELRVIEGAGHFVFEDEPEQSATAVVDWLVRGPVVASDDLPA